MKTYMKVEDMTMKVVVKVKREMEEKLSGREVEVGIKMRIG